jgi:hypothetical protein
MTPEQIEIWQRKEALPRYQSHKIVRAAKIRHIERSAWGANMHLELPDQTELVRITVNTDYLAKHQPHSGGYYVFYEDGYESFSPAPAFQDGYTRALEYEAQTEEAATKRLAPFAGSDPEGGGV